MVETDRVQCVKISLGLYSLLIMYLFEMVFVFTSIHYVHLNIHKN